MYEYYAVLQTEMEDLQPGAAAPAPAAVAAGADADEVEALWTELSMLQETVKAAAEGNASELGDCNAAMEENSRIASAACASLEAKVSSLAMEPAAAATPDFTGEQVAELEAVVVVLDETVANMAAQVGLRMDLTEAACLSRVEWLDRRLCVVEGKPPMDVPVSQLTGHLDAVKVLTAAAAVAAAAPA